MMTYTVSTAENGNVVVNLYREDGTLARCRAFETNNKALGYIEGLNVMAEEAESPVQLHHSHS